MTRTSDLIQVRSLRPDEWGVWRDLRLQALADSPDAFGETLDNAKQRRDTDWREFAAAATLPDRRILVAEHDTRPVGMALVRLSPTDSSHANLYAMWVVPTARGIGVGRALVEAAREWAQSAGVTEITLHVTEGNERAKGLYRATGFVATGAREPLRPGANLQTEVMVMRIARGHVI